jgi:carbamoylphosphate synthase large subunit
MIQNNSHKYNILFPRGGQAGVENLMRSIKNSSINCICHAFNSDVYQLSKSASDIKFLLPTIKSKEFIPKLVNYIIDNQIDCIMPNGITLEHNVVFNEIINQRMLLPDRMTMKICQDKSLTYNVLTEKNIKMAETINVKNLDDIKFFFEKRKRNRYWIRARKGSGSVAATWVRN